MHFVEFVAATLVLVAILLFVYRAQVQWRLEPEREVRVVTVDRSGPAGAAAESMRWLVRHLHARPVAQSAAKADLIVLADPGSDGYDAELERLRTAHADGRRIWAQHPLLTSPNPPAVRRELGRMLGVQGSGWVGSHVEDLASPRLDAIRERWLATHPGEEWTYSGPGIYLAAVNGRVVVFEQAQLPVVRFNADAARRWGAPRELTWDGSFEIALATEASTVHATLDPRLGDGSLEALAAAGVPAPPWTAVTTGAAPARHLYMGIAAIGRAELPQTYSRAGLMRRHGLRARRRDDHRTAFVLLAIGPTLEHTLAELDED